MQGYLITKMQSIHSPGVNGLKLSVRGPSLFRRLKTVPALKELKYFQWPQTHNIGIQTNQKELTKTFMMISN